MSLMTQSLLLQAQSLRLEGEIDSSIDLLRVVLSQCSTDLRAALERAGINDDTVTTPLGIVIPARIAAIVDDHEDHPERGRLIDRIEEESREIRRRRAEVRAENETTLRLRRMAAYQLALLLLQRSGRRGWISSGEGNGNNGQEDDDDHDDDSDEREADELLWKLGYRLRLSKFALGYPPCTGCHRKRKDAEQSSLQKMGSNLTVIDGLLPESMFESLRNAFRPESRYWSDFYSKANSNYDAAGFTSEEDAARRENRNQFASHNIVLPAHGASSSILHQLQHSKSLVEQVAIIAMHRLKDRFPGLTEATSVEVWSHGRPVDGQHQLHYDMDEVLLLRPRE